MLYSEKLKRTVHPKKKKCVNLLTLKLFQTCLSWLIIEENLQFIVPLTSIVWKTCYEYQLGTIPLETFSFNFFLKCNTMHFLNKCIQISYNILMVLLQRFSATAT